MQRAKMYTPREAAKILGVSYPTLKQWIYRGRVRTAKTQGGHHRIPETEIDRLLRLRISALVSSPAAKTSAASVGAISL